MIVLFTLIQIYIPTYRWELKFAKKITSTSIQIVSGKIINVVHYADYYDHQRMSSIIISSDKREIQLYIRPWLYRQIFKNGENIEFEVVSKVIVSYKTGEQT